MPMHLPCLIRDPENSMLVCSEKSALRFVTRSGVFYRMMSWSTLSVRDSTLSSLISAGTLSPVLSYQGTKNVKIMLSNDHKILKWLTLTMSPGTMKVGLASLHFPFSRFASIQLSPKSRKRSIVSSTSVDDFSP